LVDRALFGLYFMLADSMSNFQGKSYNRHHVSHFYCTLNNLMPGLRWSSFLIDEIPIH
jgi:hypothetical protein